MLFTLAALYNFFLESFNQIKQNMAWVIYFFAQINI